MREVLGVFTGVSTASTPSLDERIESIVEERLSGFAANQNDLLNRLQERLQQLEVQVVQLSLSDRSPSPVVDAAVDSVDREETLTQAELAKRLDVDSATLTKNRSKSNFANWSQDKDPDQKAWSYLPELKRYCSLSSTDLSTQSTAVDAVNDEDLVGDRWRNRVDEVVGNLL
jgi:hypothetical protein